MLYLRVIFMIIMVSLTILAPAGLIAGGFVLHLPWWGRLAMVTGGLVILWLIKPLSIITGRNLGI